MDFLTEDRVDKVSQLSQTVHYHRTPDVSSFTVKVDRTSVHGVEDMDRVVSHPPFRVKGRRGTLPFSQPCTCVVRFKRSSMVPLPKTRWTDPCDYFDLYETYGPPVIIVSVVKFDPVTQLSGCLRDRTNRPLTEEDMFRLGILNPTLT